MNTASVKETGLYIHIPFCASKCFYCDFLSFVPAPGQIEVYMDTLFKEIENTDISGRIISTIFIGGGTPSILPKDYLPRVLDKLSKYSIAHDAEITVEANPGTLDIEKLRAYKKSGINRLSMGLQSADCHILNNIGRIHTYTQAYDNFNNARDAGFKNINLDIMFSLPGQTMEKLADTLERVVFLSPEHVSAYSLTVEDDTVLDKLIAENKLQYPDDKSDREMYHFIKAFLMNHGLIHYEISNFAKEGYECRHNVSCWKRKEYMGFGLGAHSFFDNRRFNNTSSFLQYVKSGGDKKLIMENTIDISDKDALEETMFLGLRLIKGVKITETIRRTYPQQIDKLIKMGLINESRGYLLLTEKGLDYANTVFMEFM